MWLIGHDYNSKLCAKDILEITPADIHSLVQECDATMRIVAWWFGKQKLWHQITNTFQR